MKKLYLSKDDKKVFGFCAGLAEHFDTDPTLIRLAIIFIAIMTGFLPVLLAYIIAGIITPNPPKRKTVESKTVE